MLAQFSLLASSLRNLELDCLHYSPSLQSRCFCSPPLSQFSLLAPSLRSLELDCLN